MDLEIGVLRALKSEYNIEVKEIDFKYINENMFDVYFKDDLILNVLYDMYDYEYFQGHKTIIIRISNRKNKKESIVYCSGILDNLNYDEILEEKIILSFADMDLNINSTTVINNAQEIIEITRKAKEDNIKKDIDTIESEILKRARDGEDDLIYYLSELKTDIGSGESDNEIIKHFRNKGFSCFVKYGSLAGGLLRISWGD